MSVKFSGKILRTLYTCNCYGKVCFMFSVVLNYINYKSSIAPEISVQVPHLLLHRNFNYILAVATLIGRNANEDMVGSGKVYI
jgi:hypothetical protein